MLAFRMRREVEVRNRQQYKVLCENCCTGSSAGAAHVSNWEISAYVLGTECQLSESHTRPLTRETCAGF